MSEDDDIEIIRGSKPTDADDADDAKSVTDLVQQPAKVMRIGTMIKQLLDEVKSAPLDEASRNPVSYTHLTLPTTPYV